LARHTCNRQKICDWRDPKEFKLRETEVSEDKKEKKRKEKKRKEDNALALLCDGRCLTDLHWNS